MDNEISAIAVKRRTTFPRLNHQLMYVRGVTDESLSLDKYNWKLLGARTGEGRKGKPLTLTNRIVRVNL